MQTNDYGNILLMLFPSEVEVGRDWGGGGGGGGERQRERERERERERKSVLFNDALNTFYIQLYDVR